ncbi:MAG: NUDIX hydrolase [Micropepsaceae bacterium]
MKKRGPLTIRGERPVFANPWIMGVDYHVETPAGRAFTYTIVHFRNWATGVVPLHDDGTVTMVGQHRFALDAWSWEIPEGGASEDEGPLAGAQRELAEEAGLAGAEWREILKMHLSNSVTDEQAYVYLATGLSAVEAHPDDTEDLSVVRVPFAQVMDKVLSGEITDAITVAAILKVAHMARAGELPGGLNDLLAPKG